MYSLIYLAPCKYGGWVSFTAHLSLKYNLPLYKAGNKTEQRKDGTPILRNYGYGAKYQNLSIKDIQSKPNPIITAIHKKMYGSLESMPDGTFIVIHDPTELHGKAAKPLLEHINRFKIITIRKSVQDFIKEKYNLESTFIIHPFYEYPITKSINPQKNVCISRIDYDKHIDIILKANKSIPEANAIYLHGAANPFYPYNCLKGLDYEKYYKKAFKKDFKELDKILKDTKYVVDMSAIKNDGGGTQYTFLEAIYHKCILVLHKKWLSKESIFVSGINCYVVESESELAELINRDCTASHNSYLLDNSFEILKAHTSVNWIEELLLIKQKKAS
jgi:hypothetical protein